MKWSVYKCKQHGEFELPGPHCPHCGVKSLFVRPVKTKIMFKDGEQPPASHTGKVKKTDMLLNRLMGEFGLTDVPKPTDARDKVSGVKKLRSNDQTPMPTPMGAPAQMQVSVPDTATLAGASGQGNEVMASISPSYSPAVKPSTVRHRRPPISLSIEAND